MLLEEIRVSLSLMQGNCAEAGDWREQLCLNILVQISLVYLECLHYILQYKRERAKVRTEVKVFFKKN